jgi:hypothetical protein
MYRVLFINQKAKGSNFNRTHRILLFRLTNTAAVEHPSSTCLKYRLHKRVGPKRGEYLPTYMGKTWDLRTEGYVQGRRKSVIERCKSI